jgi:hypothetical protein
MDDRDDGFLEDLDSIASILASGYLRCRKLRRRVLLRAGRPKALDRNEERTIRWSGSPGFAVMRSAAGNCPNCAGCTPPTSAAPFIRRSRIGLRSSLMLPEPSPAGYKSFMLGRLPLPGFDATPRYSGSWERSIHTWEPRFEYEAAF